MIEGGCLTLVLEKEMSVSLSKDIQSETLHWLSVTSFLPEISIVKVVVVGSGYGWVDYTVLRSIWPLSYSL